MDSASQFKGRFDSGRGIDVLNGIAWDRNKSRIFGKNVSYIKKKLSKHTPFFGIQVWILIITLIALFLLIILTILYLCIIFHRRKKSYKPRFFLPRNPISAKTYQNHHFSTSSLDSRLLSASNNISEIEMNLSKPEFQMMLSDPCSIKSSLVTDLESTAGLSERQYGNRCSLKEIALVTNDFSGENMIASGDNGMVYRAVLLDNKRVAVKRLIMSNSQTENFIKEVEAIGLVRHKNLVKLLGYCVEGYNRILVYEYIDNGNLYQWLHGSLGQLRPLTWGMRMNIIQGVAKALAYLHEDIEPKIIHQNLKSSNILIDHQWNPKISDVGIANLHGPEWSSLTNCAMGKSVYVCRESTGSILDEKNDVYSFGILIMEIVSGRVSVDHTQPEGHLVDWLKSMVAKQKISFVVDPKLPEMPSTKELKRVILIALRCVDPEVKHRPKMGDVVHMLEPRDLLLNVGPQIKKAASYHKYPQERQPVIKLGNENSNTHESESSSNRYQMKI
ncbi:putative receptor-like protein kinase At2g30940 [Pistacia vera]|uniref:putative receptor-like protein kinase At2g30940 n=1 Tax=Pistacia vera TaxID=55513 RepID=UPI001262DA83|nr:putative receptor-like protein kinase At2g30940 [Pistacia vera]